MCVLANEQSNPGMLDLDGGGDLIGSVNFWIFHDFFFQYSFGFDLINYWLHDDEI